MCKRFAYSKVASDKVFSIKYLLFLYFWRESTNPLNFDSVKEEKSFSTFFLDRMKVIFYIKKSREKEKRKEKNFVSGRDEGSDLTLPR